MTAVSTFARRSFLYIPGDSARKNEKAAALGADTLILDLEDGVARSQKDAARATVAGALAHLDFGRRERLVRINHPTHGLLEAELAAILQTPPDGVVLPKVEAAPDLLRLDTLLGEAEQARGWPRGRLRLFAMIETARGVLHLAEIAAATPRLAGLVYGAEAVTADVGAIRNASGRELPHARRARGTAADALRGHGW